MPESAATLAGGHTSRMPDPVSLPSLHLSTTVLPAISCRRCGTTRAVQPNAAHPGGLRSPQRIALPGIHFRNISRVLPSCSCLERTDLRTAPLQPYKPKDSLSANPHLTTLPSLFSCTLAAGVRLPAYTLALMLLRKRKMPSPSLHFFGPCLLHAHDFTCLPCSFCTCSFLSRSAG